eukprot:4661357-Amphidinium_carterae.1
MLSGRSAVVVAYGHEKVRLVFARCRRRLSLAEDGTMMELWHGSDKVPDDDTSVRDWPGVQ